MTEICNKYKPDFVFSNCIQNRSKVNELSTWKKMQFNIAFFSFVFCQEQLKKAQEAQDDFDRRTKSIDFIN